MIEYLISKNKILMQLKNLKTQNITYIFILIYIVLNYNSLLFINLDKKLCLQRTNTNTMKTIAEKYILLNMKNIIYSFFVKKGDFRLNSCYNPVQTSVFSRN